MIPYMGMLAEKLLYAALKVHHAEDDDRQE
jgi:hypothetical protein